MNFESIIALLLLVQNNGKYLLIDIIDPLSPVGNVHSTDINSYARSRRLEFQKKNFKNFGKKNFRSLNVEDTESDMCNECEAAGFLKINEAVGTIPEDDYSHRMCYERCVGPIPTTTEYVTIDYTAEDFNSDSSESSVDSSASINPMLHDYFHKIEKSTIATNENSISDLGSDTRMATNIPYSEKPTAFLPEPVKKTLKDTCKEWGDCMEVFGNTPQRKICEKMCSDASGPKSSDVKTDAKTKPCHGKPTFGPCRMGIHGYTYDSLTKTCQNFRDGGCGMTRNGFFKKEECEMKCASGDEDKPETKQDSGTTKSVSEPKICCRAFNAWCEACVTGMSVREYCMKNPETPGCSSSNRCDGKKCGDECVIGKTRGWCDNKEMCRKSHVKCAKDSLAIAGSPSTIKSTTTFENTISPSARNRVTKSSRFVTPKHIQESTKGKNQAASTKMIKHR